MNDKNNNKNMMVRKSNELIEARYKLSLGEQRLILLLATQIYHNDTHFKDYEIRVDDFARMFELKSDKSLYETVEKIASDLLGKRLYLKNDTKNFEGTVWLSYVKYIRGSGVIKLRFDDCLKPYLLQLRESISGFTKYQLATIMKFKSAYSIRLYELLKMEVWKAEKANKNYFRKTFSLDEYRELLGIDKKAYSIFADLKKWTILPPIREITEHTDLSSINVEYLKTGRKITGILFHVQLNMAHVQSISDTELTTTIAENTIIADLVVLGFPKELAAFYEYHYDAPRIERNIAYVKAKQQQGLVNDFPAYLNKAIKDDLGSAWKAEQAKQAAEQEQRKLTAQQRELELTLREERSQRENDRRMQQLLKERGLDNAFDKDELSLALEQLLKIKIQK